MVISASRRSDIPRFYADWFMDRIRAGSVEVANPFNARQVRLVSLDPKKVDAVVFWTRDPRPLFPHLAELDERGYRYYFMTTLTGYPKEIEPGGVPAADILEGLSILSDRIGKSRSIWRYDPVFLSSATDEVFHLENFEKLASALCGNVERVVFSAYDEYRKSKSRVAALSGLGIHVRPAHGERGHLLPETLALFGELAQRARTAGIEPRSCAEEDDLTLYGIGANACIDAELISKLWEIKLEVHKDRNQRPACRCVASVDIGAYDTCPAGCVYCYATSAAKQKTCDFNNRFEIL
jgi:hypothetical protein